MAECSKCGKNAMTFTCRYCGEKFCSEHRLPENHKCEGLEEGVKKEKKETQKWFEEKKLKKETMKGQPRKPVGNSFSKDIISTLKTNATLGIISVTVLAFILQYTIPGFQNLLILEPDLNSVASKPWSLLTVMLLHGGMFHLFANMVTFYFFGSAVEKTIGTARTLKFYIVSGLVASIGFVVFRNILYLLHGPAIGGVETLGPAVGASGAVVAFLGVVAMLYPDAEVLLYFFIPMKIKTAVMAFGAIELFNMGAKLAGETLPIIGFFASSAHLSGLAVGLLYGKMLQDRYRKKSAVFDPLDM